MFVIWILAGRWRHPYTGPAGSGADRRNQGLIAVPWAASTLLLTTGTIQKSPLGVLDVSGLQIASLETVI
jgi:hypothetical protein